MNFNLNKGLKIPAKSKFVVEILPKYDVLYDVKNRKEKCAREK